MLKQFQLSTVNFSFYQLNQEWWSYFFTKLGILYFYDSYKKYSMYYGMKLIPTVLVLIFTLTKQYVDTEIDMNSYKTQVFKTLNITTIELYKINV